MGKRTLMVNAEVLVMFLKEPGERHRSYTVASPLPNDAHIVGYKPPRYDGGPIGVVMESADWFGDDDNPIDSPAITVHYGALAGG